jgi:hypothetical protein
MLAPNEQTSTPANKRSTTDADTIAFLRAQPAMPTVPAPSATIAPVAVDPPPPDFNRDMMAIMSHILPGNDAVEDIINRYYKKKRSASKSKTQIKHRSWFST